MNDFDAALKIDPKNVAVLLSRASLNIAEGKYKAADEDLDPILKANPDNFMAQLPARVSKTPNSSNTPRPIACLIACRRCSRSYPAGYYLQGATKFALGQYAQAETILDRYLAVAPGDRRAARLAAAAALRQRAPARAIDYLTAGRRQARSRCGDADPARQRLYGQRQARTGASAIRQGGGDRPQQPDDRDAGGDLGDRRRTGQRRPGGTRTGIRHRRPARRSPARPWCWRNCAPASSTKPPRLPPPWSSATPTIALYQTLSGMVKAAQKDVSGGGNRVSRRAARQTRISRRREAIWRRSTCRPGAPTMPRNCISRRWRKNRMTKPLCSAWRTLPSIQKKWPEAIDYINRARTAAPNDPAPGLALVRVYELQQDWANAKAVAGALDAQFPVRSQCPRGAGAGPARGWRQPTAPSQATSGRTRWRPTRTRCCRATSPCSPLPAITARQAASSTTRSTATPRTAR